MTLAGFLLRYKLSFQVLSKKALLKFVNAFLYFISFIFFFIYSRYKLADIL